MRDGLLPMRSLHRRSGLLVGLAVLALLLTPRGDSAAASLAADALPLETGNSWLYTNLLSPEDELRVVTGSAPVGSSTTLVLETIGGTNDGGMQFLTNGGGGLQVRKLILALALGDAETEELSPPLTLLPAEFDVGTMLMGMGIVSVTIDFFGTPTTFDTRWESTVAVTAFEQVIVPAGTFDAFRVESTLGFSTLPPFPLPIEITLSDTSWYALGVGVVKQEGVFDGDPFSLELVSTNVSVPEPAAGVLLGLSLASLALARRRNG